MAPEIDGKIFITEIEGASEEAPPPPPGTLATVEITEASDYDLIGRVVDYPVAPSLCESQNKTVRAGIRPFSGPPLPGIFVSR
jgi:hypothetical protein